MFPKHNTFSGRACFEPPKTCSYRNLLIHKPIFLGTLDNMYGPSHIDLKFPAPKGSLSPSYTKTRSPLDKILGLTDLSYWLFTRCLCASFVVSVSLHCSFKFSKCRKFHSKPEVPCSNCIASFNNGISHLIGVTASTP